jgi:hypothetical protein
LIVVHGLLPRLILSPPAAARRGRWQERQLHDSTARGSEVRTALAAMAGIATGAKVIDLAAARRRAKKAA